MVVIFFKKNELRIKKYNILFIEQPVKSGKDHLIKTGLHLCADESFHFNKQFKKIKKIIAGLISNQINLVVKLMF